jgi:hypothetical protein
VPNVQLRDTDMCCAELCSAAREPSPQSCVRLRAAAGLRLYKALAV